MTSKQYYKQTSDMAFKVNDWKFDAFTNTIKSTVKLEHSQLPDAFLNDNDFYAIGGIETALENGLELSSVKFEITFSLENGDKYIYNLNVCDTIDCRVGGGDMVFSCDGFSLKNVINAKKQEVPAPSCGCTCHELKPFPKFPDFGMEFPKTIFGDNDSWFNQMTESVNGFFNDIDKTIESLKKSGDKFYSVEYSMDGNGNGHYRKVDNDGVVEKNFKRIDGEVKEVGCDCGCTKEKKTELKELLK